MKLYFVFAVFLSTAYSEEDIIDAGESNIAGGSFVGPYNRDQFKFMASLQFKKVFNIETKTFSEFGHYCGASLVNKNFAISAATCLDDDLILQKGNIIVVEKIIRVGILNKNDDNFQDMQIKEVMFNPEYNKSEDPSVNGNIAVIRVSCEYSFNAFVAPIKWSDMNVPSRYTDCVAAGWGRQGPSATKIRPMNLKMISVFITSEHYNIIKVFPKNRGGICEGDIGGPLVCNNVLVGVAIDHQDCSTAPSRYHNFTSIPYYNSWLQTILE